MTARQNILRVLRHHGLESAIADIEEHADRIFARPDGQALWLYVRENHYVIPPMGSPQNNTVTVTTMPTPAGCWSFCPGCGQRLEAGWSYCAGCGKAIGQAALPWTPYNPMP